MQVTSTQQNSKTKRHDFVELSHYLNNSKGFTLVELLISIAIIGILAAVGIPQYTQYKVRGYDAHSKQALKDMHLLCNAYWLDTDTLQGCDLPKIKEATYGFNQNADVVATLPPSPLDNFCASAKHNDSPNTLSIDSAALISSGSDCSGAGGSVQTASVSPAQTFESYQPPEIACSENGKGRGVWTVVDSNGRLAGNWAETGANPVMHCTCEWCGPNGGSYNSAVWVWYGIPARSAARQEVPSTGHKLIYLGAPA